MRVLVLLLVAVTIAAAYANSFLKNEEYTTVQERKQSMDEAIEEAKAAMESTELANKNVVITKNQEGGKYTSSQLRNKFFKKPSEEARKMGKANNLYRDIVNRAERKMFKIKRAKIAKSEGAEARAESLAEMLFHRPGSMLTSQEVARAWRVAGNFFYPSPIPPKCGFPTVYLYRTINGKCNNLKNPLLGSSGTAFKRLVPPSYEDGISSLRGTLQAQKKISTIGPFLPPHPSPRLISATVIINKTQDEIPFTHLLMQFGQFLDHDLDLGPLFEDECDGCTFSDNCQPIRVPDLDESFGVGTRNNADCLPFVRSMTVFDKMNPQQTVKPLEQLNDVTSFIDGSMIYGSSKIRSKFVRSERDGLLRVGDNIPMNKPSLPLDKNEQVDCPNTMMKCFLCGDNRCNEHTALTIMHTIWLREHNRCARKMAEINPHWDDEKLYQVCRKIVGALIQKITYEDYLPIVMGHNVDNFIGPYTGYNNMIDPSIPNSFATAAYRYGHSLIRLSFDRLDKAYQPLPIGPLKLLDAFNSPNMFMLSLGTDPIMRGLVTVNSRRMDEFMNSVLTTQLFQTPAVQGADLASLNLQRGRDHGLPPYLIYRNFCSKKFGITSGIENELTLVRFLQLYGSLETADVWLAGMAEDRPSDGLLGATFACIFGLTFKDVREGDRFFWLRPGMFTAKQRLSIKSDSISRVICENSDGITSIQRNAFLSNQTRVSCSRLGRVDLNLFREPACFIRAFMYPRLYETTISIFSRSIQPQFDFTTRVIPPNTRNLICIPIQCPTVSIDTRVMVYSSIKLRQRTTITRNLGLPPTTGTTEGFYQASLSRSNFDNNRGLFINNVCESSPYVSFTADANFTDDVSFTFNIAPAPLKAKLASEEDELPQKIMDELDSDNTDAELESVEEVNSQLLGNAEMEKQEVIKKTASLFIELEEALKKLN